MNIESPQDAIDRLTNITKDWIAPSDTFAADIRAVIEAARLVANHLMIPAVACETCGGSGYGGNAGHVYNSDDEYHGMAEHQCVQCPVPCPANCVNGLVPSPEAIETAARKMYAEVGTRRDSTLTYDIAYPEEQDDFKRVAEKMLVAAAFTPPGATDGD